MTDEAGKPGEGAEPEPVDLASLLGSFQPLADYNRSINAQIAKSLAEALTPLRVQVGEWSKQLAAVVDANALVRQAIEPLNERFRDQWRDVFASIGELAKALYPENLRDVRPSVKDFEQLLLEEGIPLMRVPGPEVVRALLDAPDVAARRRLIGRRWKVIVNDCEAVAASVDHPDLKAARGFALDCVAALRAGHTNPAQALAANLLDSLLRVHLKDADRRKLTYNKKGGPKFGLNNYGVRVALTFAPIWYAHAEYWPKDGDPIPRVFGRHPSAHGVSRLQYSRINAVHGLMLVTSVLKFFDVELRR